MKHAVKNIAIRLLACGLVPLAAMFGATGQEVPPPNAQDCSSCHACPEPTPNAPCLTPCPRPAEAAAPTDKGPEVIVLDRLEKLYEAVTFNHGAHAAMSDTSGGCQVCHHYGPTDPIPPCSACHAEQATWDNLRQPSLRGAYHRQCMGCHREWSHEAACGECHAPKNEGTQAVAELKIDLGGPKHPPIQVEDTYLYETPEVADTVVAFHHEDHVAVFNLACAACHRNESCATCHDTGAKQPARNRASTHASCAACHTPAIESNCMYCHTEEPKPRFSHGSSTGFALDELHALLACGDCHGGRTSGPTRCDSCHETAEGPLPEVPAEAVPATEAN